MKEDSGGSYCVDANVFIASWSKMYPPHVFPSLWEQIARHRKDIVLIEPVYDEIDPISKSDEKRWSSDSGLRKQHPLRAWLINNQFSPAPVDDQVERLALDLERKYEIKNESEGVDEVDLKVVAYAKKMDKKIITFENDQPNIPKKKYKYKIPLVCKAEGVGCTPFVDMLKDLNIRI